MRSESTKKKMTGRKRYPTFPPQFLAFKKIIDFIGNRKYAPTGSRSRNYTDHDEVAASNDDE